MGLETPREVVLVRPADGLPGEWLYRFVLGIDQEPGTAGFEKLLVRPHPGG